MTIAILLFMFFSLLVLIFGKAFVRNINNMGNNNHQTAIYKNNKVLKPFTIFFYIAFIAAFVFVGWAATHEMPDVDSTTLFLMDFLLFVFAAYIPALDEEWGIHYLKKG